MSNTQNILGFSAENLWSPPIGQDNLKTVPACIESNSWLKVSASIFWSGFFVWLPMVINLSTLIRTGEEVSYSNFLAAGSQKRPFGIFKYYDLFSM